MKVNCIFVSMVVLRFLLFPFAVLFDLVTSFRNRLYDLKFRPSAEFEVPVISVGNLAVGGTGKTPLVEHLVRLLSPNYQLATLSRGYGRKTKGFRIAAAGDNASTLGDESFQFFRKFKTKAVVSVGEERALAIPMLLDQFPDLQIILLDDAFQHRKVKPLFSVLLTDYHNLFYDDVLLPAGKLREGRHGAARADIVVVSKCPAEIQEEEMMRIEQEIRKYCDKPVFFAGIHYVEPLPFSHTMHTMSDTVVLVSGIANPRTFVEFAGKNFRVVKHFNFDDHHDYSSGNVQAIVDFARKNSAVLLTTEKDAVKLDHTQFQTILSNLDCYYVPIETEFIKSGRDFDEMILNAIQQAEYKKDVQASVPDQS
jgi:tetraacyldisaccharide 4'-kinase